MRKKKLKKIPASDLPPREVPAVAVLPVFWPLLLPSFHITLYIFVDISLPLLATIPASERPALRAVRNASGEHLPYVRRTAIGWRGCCFVSQRRYAQSSRRSRCEWMGSSPSMRPKNAIGKTLSSSASFRSNPIRTITGPTIRRQKSSRQVGA